MGLTKNGKNQKYYLYRKENLDIKTTSELNGSFVFDDILLGKHDINEQINIVCCKDEKLKFCKKPFECVIGEKCEIP